MTNRPNRSASETYTLKSWNNTNPGSLSEIEEESTISEQEFARVMARMARGARREGMADIAEIMRQSSSISGTLA